MRKPRFRLARMTARAPLTARGPLTVVALLTALAVVGCAPDGHSGLSADDVDGAWGLLEESRADVLAATDLSTAERVREMTRLGLWDEAWELAGEAGAEADANPADPDLQVALGHLLFLESRFHEAEERTRIALDADIDHREARLLEGMLRVQAWELDEGAGIAEALLQDDPRDEDAALLLGRIRLLEKDYDAALELAREVQRWNRRSAGAYLLEADTRFWDQDPEGAEPPLVRALELDPFNPDARFNYGYAIWRRVDATQLDDMAAQWNLGLEVHPLHYVANWHWGNGHTNLTYADYIHPTDDAVRERLAEADELISQNRIEEAAALTREVEEEFPESVLPAMMRGSAYYMAYDMDLEVRLDSALAIFREVLERKPNYGPAHNGLASVVKYRGFTYLSAYDSLDAAIAATPLPDDPHFESIFFDVDYFPGDRVQRMVRSQLGPGIAYLPLIDRLGSSYTIFALHKDIGEALGSAQIRTSTTFDNRQWMDIRGAGSGAAGLDYVDRGAFWERNVVAHEYAHQFHGRLLTDAEDRRIRELYFEAMEGGYTLDYYASNNPAEFFAQGYEAYMMPVKVHPLNHKAMNTVDDLRELDPAFYAFLDSLAVRADAYLAGDESVYASNWAEVYLNLANQARGGGGGGGGAWGGGSSQPDFEGARMLLDSALAWDESYVPAVLGYAALATAEGSFGEAEEWLVRAETLDPQYPPVFQRRAELVAARSRAGELDEEEAFREREDLYTVALGYEDDLQYRASLNQTIRNLYADYARIPEAIAIAEEYMETAPTVSTGLRNSHAAAVTFAEDLRASAGRPGDAVPVLRDLVAQRPQDYGLRGRYADALAAAGDFDQAEATLQEVQRILAAAGNPRADYMVQMARFRVERGDEVGAREVLEPVLSGERSVGAGDPGLIRVLASLGAWERVEEELALLGEDGPPRARAEADYTRAWVSQLRGEEELAEERYRRAIETNPFLADARLGLMRLLTAEGRGEEARVVMEEGRELELAPETARLEEALVD
jgi:tetratricopeptide (TPR) repeat protein